MLRSICWMLGAALLAAGALQAQTTVSGTITENTTWTLAGSPYTLVESVTVNVDVTLTIRPGVEVLLGNRRNLYVEGRLLARGTASSPVRFVGPEGGAREGIISLFGPGSALDHVVIERLGYSSAIGEYDVAVLVTHSDVAISNATIADSYQTALLVDGGADPTLNRLNITGSEIYGLLNYATEIVDADNIWWGDASGPFHPTLNPGGLGDRVSDNVDFIPWRTSPVQIQNVVAQPALFLSAGSVALGGAVTISGEGFTPSGSVRLSVTGPSGHVPLNETLTATSGGAFAYTSTTAPGTTPPGT